MASRRNLSLFNIRYVDHHLVLTSWRMFRSLPMYLAREDSCCWSFNFLVAWVDLLKYCTMAHSSYPLTNWHFRNFPCSPLTNWSPPPHVTPGVYEAPANFKIPKIPTEFSFGIGLVNTEKIPKGSYQNTESICNSNVDTEVLSSCNKVYIKCHQSVIE